MKRVKPAEAEYLATAGFSLHVELQSDNLCSDMQLCSAELYTSKQLYRL